MRCARSAACAVLLNLPLPRGGASRGRWARPRCHRLAGAAATAATAATTRLSVSPRKVLT